MVPTEKTAANSDVLQPRSDKRVPMRNRQEALFTRWHLDLGFPHLRESLLTVFPALRDRLPTNEEVLKFQEIRRQWVTHLRGADPKSRSAEKNVVVQELGAQLNALEYRWAPPPHMRADMDHTPIPAYFFKEAAGELATWDLRRVHKKDLVPQEQADLMQDVPSIPLLKRIASCEARACISLCRPEGRYVNRRKLKGRRAPIVATQPFHAGEFSYDL